MALHAGTGQLGRSQLCVLADGRKDEQPAFQPGFGRLGHGPCGFDRTAGPGCAGGVAGWSPDPEIRTGTPVSTP